jgi:predicted TIM-barrel fold metal-dependent hydrolase
MWRMDMDWPITRREIPWVKRLPSDYLAQHVRFIADRVAGPPADQPDIVAEWAQRTGAASMLLYGSGWPHWSTASPDDVLAALPEDDRRRVLHGNAEDLYGNRLAAAGV